MTNLAVQIRITSVRSRGVFGGVIFSGRTEDATQYVVVCNHTLMPDSSMVDKGQIWKICGIPTQRTTVVKGYQLKETQIEATDAELERPAGRNIIAWIAESPDCVGIGRVKAARLYEHFGTELIEHIENKNVMALATLIDPDDAQILCHAFSKHRAANTLLWLDRVNIPRRIGAGVVAFYKDQAEEKILANPYVLIAFEASWSAVDELACKRFGVQLNDPKRLESAIEEVLYRGLKDGHTCLQKKEVHIRLVRLLGSASLALQALSVSGAQDAQCGNTQFKEVDGFYQSTGAYLIESYVAQRLKAMIAGENAQGQKSLFGLPGRDLGGVESVLEEYENAANIVLTKEQRDAVLTSAGNHMSLILGGAGTGKTTVLKALYAAMESLHPDIRIHQLALAGRAAQRMVEATGRESMTIAGFLSRTATWQIEMGSMIVVDEVSMVDVILMYRLLRHLPLGVRLVLVGDPSQLPPIGPGLILHALAAIPAVPQVELKVVKRQSAASGIPQVAAAIRAHQIPEWAPYLGKSASGVSFVPCAPEVLDDTVQRIYAEIGGDGSDSSVQILSVTNAGFGGVKNLNCALHSEYRMNAEQVFCFDPQFEVVNATTLDRLPLKVGDLVMFLENDYELGLRNGSLGKIIKALPVNSADDHCCICDFEGVEYLLKTKQLNALNHAYAITVHKSQGSQFQRVIVPIRASRLLDQTLVYTAVTRGVDQVILVGNEEAALVAIQAPALATKRNILLPKYLQESDGLC